MDISLQVVQSGSDRRKFVQFPWKIYHGDPFWVAPIISDLLGRLDPQHNPFWHTAEQVLWLATRAGKTVGRIAGIIDQHMIDTLRQPIACFGCRQRVGSKKRDAHPAWAFQSKCKR
jgi:hypothetical protein